MTLTEFLLARIAEREAAIIYAHEHGMAFPVLSPAEMLAECEAKRRIVEFSRSFDVMFYDADSVFDARAAVAGSAACVVALQHLAAVYADHPDCREEWKA